MRSCLQKGRVAQMHPVKKAQGDNAFSFFQILSPHTAKKLFTVVMVSPVTRPSMRNSPLPA